ncbi:MAG: hypothetical protein ACRDD7_01855, partial [Peptostreptococcaceae bacterium]
MINIIKRDIEFELKTIGMNIIAFILIMFTPLIFIISLNLSYEEVDIIQQSEVFVLISSVWISIFSFKEMICENISELLSTYPTGRYNTPSKRVKKIYMFFLIILFIYTSIIHFKYEEIGLVSFFIQFAIEGLFMIIMSLFLLIYSRNANFSITLSIIYILLMNTMGQEYFSSISIMLYNIETIPLDILIGDSTKTILFIIII